MKINNFIASLLPTFTKNRVIEDGRLTRSEILEHSEPAYKSAAELLGKWKFKSEEAKDIVETFDRMVKKDRGQNMIVTINNAWKDILENLDHVEKMVDKTLNIEIVGASMTYTAANLLQFNEAVAFVSKYARKVLVYIYICETAAYEENGSGLENSLSKVEIDWIKANLVSFCTAFNVVSGKPQQIQKQFSDIPDAIVTADNVHTLGATIGEDKIDPFQMSLIPIWMNPIYHVGMFVAEWQADRYKAAKEEVRLLQLRKLNLEKLSEGKPDAKLQKEITYMETRIQGLNFKLDKMEKVNG